MAELTRESLLSAWTPTIERIAVDENGGHAFIREWSIADQLEFTKRQEAGTSSPVDIIIFSMCDSKGERLFSDADHDAVAAKLNPEWITKVAEAAGKLNGGDADEPGALEGN